MHCGSESDWLMSSNRARIDQENSMRVEKQKNVYTDVDNKLVYKTKISKERNDNALNMVAATVGISGVM